MFPAYPIDSITNGVHAVTWTASPSDRFSTSTSRSGATTTSIYAMRSVSRSTRSADARRRQTRALAGSEAAHGRWLDRDTFTIGFARRAATYKRADLLFRDVERLRSIVRKAGPIQVIYGGQGSSPRRGRQGVDPPDVRHARSLAGSIKIVYLEDYEMALGKLLTSGVDVWLNNPQKPQEASGTSGMKAALNGVPSLSVLDGWWIEGRVEGITGWAIGDSWRVASDTAIARRPRSTTSSSRRYFRSTTASGRLRHHAALLHRAERLVLQRAAHGAAVCRQCVSGADAGRQDSCARAQQVDTRGKETR